MMSVTYEFAGIVALMIAGALLWLWSSGATFVTGHALLVDGGLTAQ